MFQQAALAKTVDAWVEAKAELDKARATEAHLRMQMFEQLLPDPKEGTNTIEMDDGRKLKFVHKLNYTLDEAALPAVAEELGQDLMVKLVNWKPSLNTKPYRALDADQKLALSEALTVKPGMPQLSVVLPKKEDE